MANFRSERLFIRVAGALDFDPNEGIDVSEFAFIMVCDSDVYGRDSLRDYTFAPFDKPRWFPAAKGLATVRAIIADLEKKLSKAEPETQESLTKQIAVLRVVEDRLD